MVTRRELRDRGFSLTEMMFVVVLLGAVLGAAYAALGVLTQSASTTTANSAGANDLSYSMELIGRTLMNGQLLYASDYRVVMLNELDNGTYEVDSIYATPSPAPNAVSDELIWEKWSSNTSGTAPVGSVHASWVMSDTNANLTSSPQVPLFQYFKDSTDTSTSVMSAADKSGSPDASLAAFMGTLPGGYTVSAIGRIRLHAVATVNGGVQGDTRDTILRVRN
jgi:prepilin-type N-terminal cleavage/methylation domain-containing protein